MRPVQDKEPSKFTLLPAMRKFQISNAHFTKVSSQDDGPRTFAKMLTDKMPFVKTLWRQQTLESPALKVRGDFLGRIFCVFTLEHEPSQERNTHENNLIRRIKYIIKISA